MCRLAPVRWSRLRTGLSLFLHLLKAPSVSPPAFQTVGGAPAVFGSERRLSMAWVRTSVSRWRQMLGRPRRLVFLGPVSPSQLFRRNCSVCGALGTQAGLPGGPLRFVSMGCLISPIFCGGRRTGLQNKAFGLGWESRQLIRLERLRGPVGEHALCCNPEVSKEHQGRRSAHVLVRILAPLLCWRVFSPCERNLPD